jgi:hypothetical protein
MDERQRGPGDIPTAERIKDIGTAMASSLGSKLTGDTEPDQKGARFFVSQAEAEAMLADWPAGPTGMARQMIEQYGPPNEATPVRMIWYGNGPWKRTEVTRDEIVHNFPATHTDFITNWIDYPVPVEMMTELTRYDGSCLLDRTAGEAGARCDSEAANFITINFMHEIVTGKRSVEEARHAYAEQMAAYMLGRPAPYAERLLFDPPQGGTTDPDEGLIAPHMLNEMKEKVKDAFSS